MSLTDLYISADLTIPAYELSIRACRASGPGGQHVNKSNTKIQLSWSPTTSPSLSEEQRILVLQKLQNRINREGLVTCSVDEYRSQARNIEVARERLSSLISRALIKTKERKPTKQSRASKERRLRVKKQRSEIKSQRRNRDWS